MSKDRILVEAVLGRQKGAFEQLVASYQKLVWQIVMRMTQEPHTAEDLCQEVFLRIHLKLRTFRFECSLATWIGRLAFRIALRDQQKRAKQPAAFDLDPYSVLANLPSTENLEALVVRSDLLNHVRAAIERLPPLQQTLMALYYGENLSVAEIGVVCNQPVGTVKSYLYRARQEVRQILSTKLKEESP